MRAAPRRRAHLVLLAAVLAGLASSFAPAQPAGVAAVSPASRASPASPATPPSGTRMVTDDTGATLALPASPARIVSLAPGATEMLFAAGAGNRIVATVLAADAPEAAKKILRIGDSNALNYERLVALQPDVVVVWEDLTNRLVVDSLRKLKMPLYFIRTKSLADIPKSVRHLGAMTGTGAQANAAAAALERRLAAIGQRKIEGEPLRVFYMIWAEPLYTVGGRHIISDAIARCGGRNIFDDIAFPAPIVELESVVKRDPDLMLLSAPPITARDWRERWSRFTSIRAVQTNQLLAFSDLRLDRMGPTAIDAVEGLCARIDQARAALTALPATSATNPAPALARP